MHHCGYVFGYRIVGSGTEYRINGKVRGHLWEVYVHVICTIYIVINPRRACTARVTVVVLCVCE